MCCLAQYTSGENSKHTLTNTHNLRCTVQVRLKNQYHMITRLPFAQRQYLPAICRIINKLGYSSGQKIKYSPTIHPLLFIHYLYCWSHRSFRCYVVVGNTRNRERMFTKNVTWKSGKYCENIGIAAVLESYFFGKSYLVIQDPPSSNSGRPWYHSSNPLWYDPC